jgi:hypothetical protein
VWTLLVLFATTQSAAAEPTALASVRGGVVLPQIGNELDSSYVVAIGGGYVVPAFDHRLAIVLDAAYLRPGRDDLIADPRTETGTYRYEFVQHDFRFLLGAHYHFASLEDDVLVPYAGIGLELHVLRSVVSGTSNGDSIGELEETAVDLGAAVRIGLGVALGPGFVAVETGLSLVPVDLRIAGDSNLTHLAATPGYTLVL